MYVGFQRAAGTTHGFRPSENLVSVRNPKTCRSLQRLRSLTHLLAGLVNCEVRWIYCCVRTWIHVFLFRGKRGKKYVLIACMPADGHIWTAFIAS
jgi:hypothetical protein